MNIGTPHLSCAPGQPATPDPIAPQPRRSEPAERLTWGEVLDERGPVIGAPAFFGPPIVTVLGPWLVLVLMLVGPFALILTVLLATALAAGLVGVLVAVIASPYLLMRHLLAPAIGQAKLRAPQHLFTGYGVSASQLDSTQTKGMS